MPEHTGSSYEGKAAKYAQTVDSKPWNAFYERPATTSLLPPLDNTNVLDVGCGSGWYAEYMLARGANVTSFDLNSDFVALTKSRVGQRAQVLHADLTKPLDFAVDNAFDVVVCPLVMHYIKSWQPVFHEFYRVLKSDGVLVFSTHHPFNDWKQFNKDDYFATELLEDEWEDIGKVTFYRRPLTVISKDLVATRFFIERILEPQATEDFRRVDPEGYDRLKKNPWFIVIRAKRLGEN